MTSGDAAIAQAYATRRTRADPSVNPSRTAGGRYNRPIFGNFPGRAAPSGSRASDEQVGRDGGMKRGARCAPCRNGPS